MVDDIWRFKFFRIIVANNKVCIKQRKIYSYKSREANKSRGTEPYVSVLSISIAVLLQVTLDRRDGPSFDAEARPLRRLHPGRWDSFGRLVEPLASARPWMVTTEGNHDVERLPARPGAGALPCLQRAVAHAARRRRAVAGAGAGADSPPSGDNLYYSFDVRGGRRGARPHAGLLRRPRRGQQRVRAGKEDPCGPVYVTVGDGGNREGLAGKFVDPHSRRSRRSGTGRPASGTAGLRCHACVLGVASERQR